MKEFQLPSGNTLLLRMFRTSDYESIRAELIGSSMYDDDLDSLDALMALIRPFPDSILVAEVDGMVVGSIRAVSHAPFGFLFRLHVHSEYRLQGIGTRLQEMGLVILHGRGIQKPTIFVRDGDEGAKVFWEKNGWIPKIYAHRVFVASSPL